MIGNILLHCRVNKAESEDTIWGGYGEGVHGR